MRSSLDAKLPRGCYVEFSISCVITLVAACYIALTSKWFIDWQLSVLFHYNTVQIWASLLEMFCVIKEQTNNLWGGGVRWFRSGNQVRKKQHFHWETFLSEVLFISLSLNPWLLLYHAFSPKHFLVAMETPFLIFLHISTVTPASLPKHICLHRQSTNTYCLLL